MTASTYDGARILARLAATLDGPAPPAPRFFAFSDPDRTRNLTALASGLPSGSGLVLRTFGRADLQAAAFELADITKARDVTFLIAAEPELALRCGAAGVHWPQSRLPEAAHWRQRFPIISASAHSPSAARRASSLCDLIFVSTAFASNSPSAGRPLGPFRLAAYARRTQKPVYALGGYPTGQVFVLKVWDYQAWRRWKRSLSPKSGMHFRSEAQASCALTLRQRFLLPGK
jgi:thiamine-phosphate pyrophosphorylase